MVKAKGPNYIQPKPANATKRVSGTGTEILACLNQDYQVFLEILVKELMDHPNGKYSLRLYKEHR